MTPGLRAGWGLAIAAALLSRGVDALSGPVLRGYDAVGHVSYAFFLDLYRSVPLADQGWSYFHPPLHYGVGWLLAQTGSPELFVRGLSLWNALASLGVALLSARIVRGAFPGRPGLPLLCFVVVAFLPVWVYASPMPGNEPTMALLASAALAVHVAGERRRTAGWGRAVATGALLGAALLAKFSGLFAVLAVALQLSVRALRSPGDRRRVGLRLAVVLGVAGLLSGPYYARNLAEFGTPFPLAGQRPVVDLYEAGQPPGQRGWRDLVQVSPALFRDPSPLAPHMLHSIWGSVYAGAWVHLDRHGSNLSPGATRWMLVLGVAPTLLVLGGFGLALADLRRRPDAPETALVWLALVALAAFVRFAYVTPTFAALKPLYLLAASVAWGYFAARAVAGLGARRRLVAAAGVALAAAALGAVLAYWPRSAPESVQMAAVRSHFGDWEGAAAIYERELERSLDPEPGSAGQALSPFWARGMLAATYLRAGRAAEARDLYAESFRLRPAEPGMGVAPRSSPWVLNRVAVAAALAGDLRLAAGLLDAAPDPPAELLASRAALRARDGDWEGAEAELRRALELLPDLAPALGTLAAVLEQRGDPEATEVGRRAQRAARRAPRDFPYWVGDGRGLNTHIPMLVWQRSALALYRPTRARGAETSPGS